MMINKISAINTNNVVNEIVSKPVKPSETEPKVIDEAELNEKVRSQIKGNDTAVKNAQDGLSMLRVAEAALEDAGDILHKMRELCVNADMGGRVHVQEEIDALKPKLDYISQYTNFNAKNLLDGNSGASWSADDVNVKVRIKGGLLTINGDNAEANYRIEVLSEPGKAQVQESKIISASETMIVDDFEVFCDRELREIFPIEEPQKLMLVQGSGRTAGVTLNANDTLKDAAEKINLAIAEGLGQSAYADDLGNFAVLSDGIRSEIFDDDGKIAGYDVKSALLIRSAVQGREGEIYFSGNDSLINALGLSTVQESEEGKFTVSVYNADTNETVVSDMKVTGSKLGGMIHPNVDIEIDPMTGTVASWNEDGKNYAMTSTGTYTTNVHLSNNGVLFQVGTDEAETFAVQFGNISAMMLGVDRVSVMTEELAERSVSYIDEAVDSVVKQRTQITSYINGLENSLPEMNPSKINDAYDAQIVMRSVEFHILSRAEGAVQAQANQQPEAVFSLLGNQQ